MTKLFLSFLYTILLGCDGYENKGRYEVAVGEQAKVYYTTNSCCYYCVSNKSELKHVKLAEDKMIDPGPSGCEGCNYTRAFVFEGISAGTDTVKLKRMPGSKDCNSKDEGAEIYIMDVK